MRHCACALCVIVSPGGRIEARYYHLFRPCKKNNSDIRLDKSEPRWYNSSMSTTSTVPPTASSTRTSRRSPIDAAVAAAERQLTRMAKRKARAQARIVRIQARLEKAQASIGQYDAVLMQLQKNVQLLRSAK